MFFQDAADHDSDFGAGGFADSPVDRGALADAGDEFGGDDFEFVVAHQRIIESERRGVTYSRRGLESGEVLAVEPGATSVVGF